MRVIIFPNETGVAVISPTAQHVNDLESLIVKLVPAGTPYKIVDSEDLPSTETRQSWMWDSDQGVAVGPEPFVTPPDISRFQAKAALEMTGNLTRVSAIVARSSTMAQLAWAEAQVFRFQSPLLQNLAMSPAPTGLGLSFQQYVDLFNLAATIEV